MSSNRKNILTVFILSLFSVLLFSGAVAQTSTGSLKGQVTDPSGAVIVSATVTAKSASGQTFTAISNSQGTYDIKGLPPGKYTVTTMAKGFTVSQLTDVQVPAGQQMLDIAMDIAVEKQQVTVEDATTNVEMSSANNASATVIKGKDLDALSDDPDELASDLEALAGPAAGPNGGQIYIDGFTNGQLPPKNAIREIRVNQNPFSAQFDRLGYGRVEVFTKPGMDKWHGQFMFNENNSIWNSLSPFSPPDQPSYHSEMYSGNVSGPISKKSSFFFNVQRRNINEVSVVTATVIDPNTGLPAYVNEAVPNPRDRTSISPRVDFQLTPNNTLTARYEYETENAENNGVGGFNLPSMAYNQSEKSHNLTVSDTQVISPSVINETRFQWYRDTEPQYAVNNTYTVSVMSAFTGGGNPVGTNTDSTNRYELQNYTSMALGKHFFKFGGRMRMNNSSNNSTSNFNGTYIYNNLQDYNNHLPAQFQVNKLGPDGSTYTSVFWIDAGLYAEDDWKIRPNFTLSYGLRFESQNHISDHADFAPRVGFAWGLGSSKSAPKTVLRAGWGMFYDRFNQNYVLQTYKYNGQNQLQYIVANPEYCAVVTPTCPDLSGTTAQSPTVYVIAPNMRSPYMMQTAVTLERQVAKSSTASVTYINSRGEHTFVSQNINAPDPTTGLPPNEGGNVYQYESEGKFRQNQLIANTNIRVGSKFTVFSFYSLNYANSDTAGAGSFPSDPYNIAADYGRAQFDTRHRFMIGGNFNLPYRFSVSPFVLANSGAPFNITVGEDLNGDSIFNDRPGYAPAGAVLAPSCQQAVRQGNPYCHTAYGNFNMAPGASDSRIPINMETAPAVFTVNLRVSKVFGFGKEGGSGNSASSGGGDHGHGPGGHGPGGGGPPMGGRGPGGPMGGGGAMTSHRYNLTFSAQARNLFNHVNLAAPVGNLSSPDFGQSISLAGGPFGSNSSNRRLDLQVQFSF